MALEVIGPGFGRTGTNSLRRALEVLGFGPCHHMYEFSEHPEQLPDWEALAGVKLSIGTKYLRDTARKLTGHVRRA